MSWQTSARLERERRLKLGRVAHRPRWRVKSFMGWNFRPYTRSAQQGGVRFDLGGEQGGTPSGATVMATSRAAARTCTGGGRWGRRVRSAAASGCSGRIEHEVRSGWLTHNR